MKRIGCFVVMAALAAASAWAQDVDAGVAFDQALGRQKALPGYVEHLYGPAATSLPQPGQPAVALGPASEIGTIEHAGELRREVFPGSNTEVLRAKGRSAIRLDLATEIAQLHVAAGLVGQGRAEELTSVGASAAWIVRDLARGGPNILGNSMEIVESLTELQNIGRSTARIMKLADAMEKVSGRWQCQVDNGSSTYTGQRVSVRQLADESIDGVLTHVYLESRTFSFPGAPPRIVAAPADSSPTAFVTQNRMWVGIADGLPLRAEFSPPGRPPQRTGFTYPTAIVAIAFPECASLR